MCKAIPRVCNLLDELVYYSLPRSHIQIELTLILVSALLSFDPILVEPGLV